MHTMHERDGFDPSRHSYPLYDGRWEHDACGAGFLAHVSGQASHFIVEAALEALARLTHRGAQAADARTNDGAGIMTQIPRALLCEELEQKRITIASPQDLAVGMIFLPSQKNSPDAYAESRQIIEQTLKEVGLVFLGWRSPPIDGSVLSAHARETAPDIAQVLLARPDELALDHYARTLYYARRLIERRLRDAHLADCYIVSLSHTTLIYKGLLAPKELARFYLDLAHPRYTSALAIFHQRYSTNTFPAWPLAQPMHLLAHNGEINTVQGNQNWMQAREKGLSSPLWDGKVEDLLPVVQLDASDSARLDNVLELLAYSNRDLLHSMQMLIPPAWEKDPSLDEAQRAWCEYHAGIIEPWDGPAALVFSDGRIVGAALDRHGLRPARYTLTSQGFLIVASETGVLDYEPDEVLEHGRLGPGEMIAVDVERGLVLHNDEIKDSLARRRPYKQWLEAHLTTLRHLDDPRFHAQTLSTTFEVTAGPEALEAALDRLEQNAINAVTSGVTLLILSDNDATDLLERRQAPMPMLIAVGAVHRALIRQGLRTRTSIICETGTVCDVHQIALVLGYGAEAIVPTLALASVLPWLVSASWNI